MASRVLFARQQIDWLALFPRAVTYGVLCFLFYQIEPENCWLIALFVYMVLRQAARFVFLPNAVFEAAKHIRAEKFQEAIPFFQETIDYFTKKEWIDQYRFFLLISLSKSSFKESATCNMAYCFLKIGDVKRAKEIYQSVLIENPGNIYAGNMLDTIKIISENSSI